MRDPGTGEPVITVPALPLDAEQPGIGHPREVAAGGLGGDAADARQFRRGQRAPVHQFVEHRRAGWVADQRGDAGDHRIAGHPTPPCKFAASYAERGADASSLAVASVADGDGGRFALASRVGFREV